MTTVHNFGDALLSSMTTLLDRIFGFIPNLIGAIILLIIGWIISGIIARILDTVLKAVGFEKAVDRSGIGDFLKRASSTWTTSKVLVTLVTWFIRLIFIEAAASALNFPQITVFINNILNYLPNVVVALVILVVGALLSTVVANLVRGALSEAGMSNPGLFAGIARYAILGFAVVAALNQLMIAAVVVDTLFIGLVASLALALGLSFGLGGREVAAEITRSWYQGGQKMAKQVSTSASGNSAAASRPSTWTTKQS